MAARQEVINRLQFTQPLPPGVTPQLSPESPTGEIYRYTLNSPKDSAGNPIYTLNDLKALQDWVLEREFRRVPRIVDITSFGGTVKRYEIHPDPDRMKGFQISLNQLQAALGNANGNVGGDYVIEGSVAMNVRGVGLFGSGQDPVNRVLGMDMVMMDAYQDTCFATDLHVVPKDQRDPVWQLLTEKRIPPIPETEDRPVPRDRRAERQEVEQHVQRVERLRRIADHQEVMPAASPEETKQALSLRRCTAWQEVISKSLVDDREKQDLDPKLVEELTRPLNKDEKEQVEKVRRVVSGFPAPAIRPASEESGVADSVKRFFSNLVSAEEKPTLTEDEDEQRTAMRR